MKRMLFAICALSVAMAVTGEGVATRVEFTSQPAGASIVVDGLDRGVTPLTLFDLAPGRHLVKFRMAGYLERDRYISVLENQPLQKNEVMDPEKGLLLLKSNPEGCEISMEGVTIGMTPKLITTLNSKDVHRLTLRKAGYRPSTFDVKFQGRTPLVREETLILNSAVLTVTSEPAGAEVTVNGIVRGVTPCTVSDVPKGRATVKLHREGFNDEIRELAMNAGDRQTLALILKGEPGTLCLVSVPEGARFYLDGEPRGKSPVVIRNMKPGTYVVRAELEGYGTEERSVALGNGATAREEFRLSNQMGRIEVRSSPPGAIVLLDGKTVGTTKSADPNAEFSDILAVENVLEGEHVLTLRKDGYAEWVRHPKVQQCKTSQWNPRLKSVFIPDVEIVTAAGTRRGVFKASTPDYVQIEEIPGTLTPFLREDIIRITFLTNKTFSVGK